MVSLVCSMAYKVFINTCLNVFVWIFHILVVTLLLLFYLKFSPIIDVVRIDHDNDWNFISIDVMQNNWIALHQCNESVIGSPKYWTLKSVFG